MKRYLLLAIFATGLALLLVTPQISGLGKGRVGGGGGGRGAIGGGGGKIGGGGAGVARSPSISKGGGISRPASLPSAPKAQGPRPGGGNNFNLPGNAQRPSQLPTANRPAVQVGGGAGNLKGLGGGAGNLKGLGGGAKAPGIAGKGQGISGQRPDIGKSNFKGNIADFQKKNPGLFDRPGGGGKGIAGGGTGLPGGIGKGIAGGGKGFPGAGKGIDKGPSRNDIADWLGNRPGDRPGGGFDKKGGALDKIGGKFDKIGGGFDKKGGIGKDGINRDFVNNWKNAANIGNKTNIGDKTNIGNKIGNVNIGDLNVDMSRNANFQNLQNHGNIINNNLRPNYNNWFNNNWWNHHPVGAGNWWHYHNFYPNPAWWWRPCTWGAVTNWFPSTAWSQPVYYDYGSNVVIQDDVVYLNDQPVSSAPVYAQQAIDLANVDPPPQDAKIEWLPLGTWALSSKKDDDNPSTILQIALSKDGIISGTWYNRSTDQSAEVEGRVDPDTQRVAMHKPDQPDVVLEVGVYNLSQAASPVLMHFGTLDTQTWYLSRLDNEGDGKK